MRFVILLIDFFLSLLPSSSWLNLEFDNFFVLHVSILAEKSLVVGNQVLLELRLMELFFFKFSYLFNVLQLLLEPWLGLICNKLQVRFVAPTLLSCMIVDLKGSIRFHEVRIRLAVVLAADLVPVQRRSNQVFLAFLQTVVNVIACSSTKFSGQISALVHVHCLEALDWIKVSCIIVNILLLNQHLLQRLRMRSVVDQGLDFVRLDVLYSLLPRFY